MTITVGWTVFDDAPPGAGNLNTHEYCFAELGTASRITGGLSGGGNLARALSLPGELPMGTHVVVRNAGNGRSIEIVKQDRGYGQGGDGTHSDPAYAIDFWGWQGAHGGMDGAAALGLGGKGTGLEIVSVSGVVVGGSGARGPTKKVIKVKPGPPLSTVRPPRTDFDIAKLTLSGPKGKGKPLSASVRQAVTDASLEETIEGASTLTLVLLDWSEGLLHSELIKGSVSVRLDNLDFTLSKIARADNKMTLTFEETAVHLLRQYSKPKKANRANTTRAQFVRSMVQEVTEATIPFMCPEVNTKQPIAKPTALVARTKRRWLT